MTTSKKQKLQDANDLLKIGGIELQEVGDLDILGVHFSSNMSFAATWSQLLKLLKHRTTCSDAHLDQHHGYKLRYIMGDEGCGQVSLKLCVLFQRREQIPIYLLFGGEGSKSSCRPL